MSDAYVIEIGENAVGVVVREARGYRFHAAKRPFHSLEGKLFNTASEAHGAAINVYARSTTPASTLTPLRAIGVEPRAS